MFLFRFSLSLKHSTENQMCTLRSMYEHRAMCSGAKHIIPVRSTESLFFFFLCFANFSARFANDSKNVPNNAPANRDFQEQKSGHCNMCKALREVQRILCILGH